MCVSDHYPVKWDICAIPVSYTHLDVYKRQATYPALADVEGRIAQNVAILQEELTDEAADVYARIETIRRLLKERNRTAAILKR